MASAVENVIYSVGGLAELLGVAHHTVRRAVDRLVDAGVLPEQRIKGWRWFTPADVPTVVEALKFLGHLPADFKPEGCPWP